MPRIKLDPIHVKKLLEPTPQSIAESMTRQQRSFLLYVESCCVDGNGLLEGVRMNEADHEAAAYLRSLGYLSAFGRIPSAFLGREGAESKWSRHLTHYATLTDRGWAVAAACRRMRAEQPPGPYARAIWEDLRRSGKVAP